MSQGKPCSECDFPEFLMRGKHWTCPQCGIIWENVGGDDGGIYWESVGNVEEATREPR